LTAEPAADGALALADEVAYAAWAGALAVDVAAGELAAALELSSCPNCTKTTPRVSNITDTQRSGDDFLFSRSLLATMAAAIFSWYVI